MRTTSATAAPFHAHRNGSRIETHKHNHGEVNHDHGSLKPFDRWTYVAPDDCPGNFPDDYVYDDHGTKHIPAGGVQRNGLRPTVCGKEGGRPTRREEQLSPACRKCRRRAR